MTTTAPPRTITAPGLVHNMPDHTYHADPVKGGSLSSTGARRILDSPARYRHELEHREGRRAFDVGHVVHTKILGVGAPIVTYPDEHLTPAGNPSTKAATKAWEDEQRAAGLAIISRADLALVDAMAEAVLAHDGARKLLEMPGHSEVSAFAPDPDTGIWCRARFDRLTDDGLALDVKTTAGSASPSGFGRDAAKFGYPIQEAHYLDTYGWATGNDLPPLQFVVVEKRAPHLVAVHHFDEPTRLAGSELAARARSTYAECRAADDWPAYGDGPLIAQLPSWWFYQLDEEDEMEGLL
ncbi:MAG TPA: PD-(D/E)XK nuclease-like domain-containing protein [Jiangellaceae bacterium]|nr:PD-(D/E)XK nuclease-like domain-containing protein [Jiangellaceae bacterium]